ncbi:MAG: ATP-binding protein [Planctomycetes bacterium]|nr:ATP-binding protein [Planctomycetota bacterium]
MGEIKLRELSKGLAAGPLPADRTEKVVEALADSLKAAILSGMEAPLPGFGGFAPAGKDGTPPPGLPKADVLGDVCTRLGESDPGRVRAMVDAILEAAKNQLLEGKKVVIEDLGTLEVRRERPEIEKQPKGHRLIKPAVSALHFAPARTISTAGRILFSAADDFRKKVESVRTSSIMLVVPERDFFAKTLEYYFENAGWDIEVFTKVVDALVKIETGKAYLVILDALFEDHQKFCYALKVRRETNSVPLILLHPSEASFRVPAEVAISGDENLTQPFEFRQLLDQADAEIVRTAEEELIFEQQVNLRLPTTETAVEGVIDMAHKLLETSGLNEEGQVAVSAAFREAVVNAAQHGNKYRKEKTIEIQYLLDAEKITLVIRDQGPGFNHEQFVKSGSTRDAISAARERHQQGRMGGLGIMLMLRCCDRLEYNPQGNQLTLTKHLKARE